MSSGPSHTNNALPDWLLVGFTGHRHLADPAIIADGIRQVFDELQQLRPAIAAISSAACGADTLFAEEASRRGLPFMLVLPFTERRFKDDFKDDDAGWNRVKILLDRAIAVEEITPQPSDQEAYMEAGMKTIEPADVIVAVWDGKPAAGFGGTGDAVAYARSIGKPVVVIDPATGKFDSNSLAFLRESAAQVRHDAAAHEAAVREPRAAVTKYFISADALATKHGPRARYLVLLYVLVHLVASAMSTINLAYGESLGPFKAVISSFEAIVVFGTYFYLFRRHHHLQAEWMQARMESEVVRSFLATWEVHRHESVHYAAKPPLPGFDRLFASLLILRRLDHSARPTFDEARIEYDRLRVKNQIAYFKNQLARAKMWSGRLRKAASVATAAIVIFTVFGALESITGFHLHEPIGKAVEVVGAMFPLIAAAIGSVLLTQEYVRRSERYAEMVKLLTEQERCLGAVKTWESLGRVANCVEDELLGELSEWRAFIRFTGQMH